MSDGIGGAPAPAPAAKSAPAEVKSIPKPGGTPAPKKDAKPEAKDTAPSWSDDDDRELFERLQRSPYGKFKANGKEKPIASKDDLLSVFTSASRAEGANELVSKTKKEREEAARVAQEARELAQLVTRAREGDAEARKQLGLVPDEERKAHEEAWNKLSPEQQALYRKNHELQQRVAESERKEAEQKAEQEAKQKELRKTEVLTKAKTHAKEILKDVKEELHDVELPEIIGAMRTLLETGQRIGVDYNAEQLATYVRQRRDAALTSRVGAMKPDAALRMVLPALKTLASTPEGVQAIQEALGGDWDSISTAIAKRRHSLWSEKKKSAALGGGVKKPDDSKPDTLGKDVPMSFIRI